MARRCSIAAALDVIGDRWALLVLRELGYGQQRFNQIVRGTGAPRDVLTARLRKLETEGVIAREPNPQRATSGRYVLTKAGLELVPVLLALKEWGDQHINPDDPPVVTTHRCGAEFHPRTHCAACGATVTLDDLTVTGGDEPAPTFATSTITETVTRPDPRSAASDDHRL